VRAFYDKDMDGIGEFDLEVFKPYSEYPKHVIAARITAENPDEGFKPTSGQIDRIIFQVRRQRPESAALTSATGAAHARPRVVCPLVVHAVDGRDVRVATMLQSNTQVWGYFSVTADGGVHEFADSQFGHLFASGPTREIARKNLVMALKELFIMGEIRTTVEYLGELLETEAFKDNTIDTAWLDGIIKEKSVAVEVEPQVRARTRGEA
jgi:acetyl-CoA carboxylase/biotin carboxylase 1